MAVRLSFSSPSLLAAALVGATLGGLAACAKGRELPASPPHCGDGEQQANEACDDGVANSDTAPNACRTTCVLPSCGDHVIDANEECDDGNRTKGDGCDDRCKQEFVCGDARCDVARGEGCTVCAKDCCVCGDQVCTAEFGETCESCPSECCPACGNKKLDPGETCDDGNHVAGDGCSPGCRDEDGKPTCGNGFLETGEQCDDGNTTARDGCSPTCQIEFTCGNGTCESAAGESCELCQPDCCPSCGNGKIDSGEECDGAALGGMTCAAACYDGGALGCTHFCTYDYSTCTGTLPTCGDGVAKCHEACDGADLRGATCESAGYAGGTLSCSSACALDTSACGRLVVYLRQDFDHGCPPAGWTLAGDWECGTPTLTGPLAAASPPACLATKISGPYSPSQIYAVDVATLPPVDLTTAIEPVLMYRAWVWTEGGTYDGYNLQISTNAGTSFSPVTTVSPPYSLMIGGQPAWGGDQRMLGWQAVTADLSAYKGQTVALRYAFQSDVSQQYAGVYIDDVVVAERATVPLSITTSAGLPDGFTGTAYLAPLARTGGSSGARWRIAGGMNHTWLSIDPASGQLSGTPAAANVGPVSVTVRVEEPLYPSNFSEQTFTFNVIQVIYQSGFEGACPAGWDLTGDWQCGAPTTVGPTAAYAGTQCLATQISGNYHSGDTWGATTATSPVIDLTGLTTATLSFRMWINTESAGSILYDGANLKISANGGPFQVVTGVMPSYSGTVGGQSAWGGDQSSRGWQLVTASLAAYAGQSIRVQLAFQSDNSTTRPGVYIDDVRVVR